MVNLKVIINIILIFNLVCFILGSCTDSKTQKVKVYYTTFEKKYTIPQGIEVNGLKQGLWINYNSIGFLQNIETYVDGLVQGETVTYNEHGIIVQKAEVHQGKFRGKFECYSGKGVQTIKGIYFDNKKIGDWFYYDDNGVLTEQEKWGNGKMLTKKVFKK
ncbi:hypothetical protein GOQ04_12230 [Emticicia sp. ODNR4P]|nr:hypothetical protein [Emticicia sp. ODNR4P]